MTKGRGQGFWLFAVVGLFVSTISIVAGGGQTNPAVAAGTGGVESVLPARLLDTRPGERTVDGLFQGEGRPGASGLIELQVNGRGGVPLDAGAVMLNVTAVNPEAAGFVTVFPCGQRPVASNLNYLAGDVIPNLVFSQTGVDGSVCLFTLANADLVVDVTGFVPAGDAVAPVVPARLLDTRSGEKTADGLFQGEGRPGASGVVELQVAGRGGVPSDAVSVMLNVTAVDPEAAGFVTVFPCGQERPLASNLNYVAGDVVPNLVFAQVGAGGKVCVFILADTDLVVDVTGFVPADGGLASALPARLLDTRSGGTTVDGLFQGQGRPGVYGVVELQVTGRGGVPTGADAVMLNVTAVNPEAAGFVTVFPCGRNRPLASNLNYVAGDVVANLVFAQVGSAARVCVFTLANTDLVVDVAGYTSTCPISPTSVATVASRSECEALVALYNETGGPSWRESTGWDTATDPCTWQGVFCDSNGVQQLSLGYNNLTGPIPAEIGNLTNLSYLGLSGNQLTSLPPDVGRLTNLTGLNLGDNRLASLPPEIGNLTNLTGLSVYFNRLASLPPQIGNLTNLTNLNLTINQLESLPAEIASLSKLTNLSLGGNLLTSLPPEIGKLTNLTNLSLSDNRLASLPPEIGNLTNLTVLGLGQNRLVKMPVEIGNLTNIAYLFLDRNQLASLPPEIGNLTNLTVLGLGSNQLESLPPEIGNLTRLESLSLYNNHLGGDVTGPFAPLMTANVLSNLSLGGNGCLSTSDLALAAWLTDLDPSWDGGCP